MLESAIQVVASSTPINPIKMPTAMEDRREAMAGRWFMFMIAVRRQA
jgi:hypothetical protein